MKRALLLSLPLCLALAACSKGDDKKSGDGIPASLSFSPNSNAPRLSEAEKAEFLAEVQRLETNLAELALPAEFSSSKVEESRAKSRAALPPEAQALLAQIPQKCKLQAPEKQSLPSGPGVTIVTKDSFVNGMGCPVSFKDFSRQEIREDSDRKREVSRTDSEYLLIADIRPAKPILKQQTSKTELTSNQLSNDSTYKSYVRSIAQMTGSLTDGSEIQGNAKIEVLYLSEGGETRSVRTEAVAYMDLRFKGKDYHFAVRALGKIPDDGKGKSEVYLNGEQVSAEYLSKLGINLDN